MLSRELGLPTDGSISLEPYVLTMPGVVWLLLSNCGSSDKFDDNLVNQFCI
jgi:hypothetical protein